MDRREFIKKTAAAAGAIIPLGKLPIMAGPFTKADYTTIIPINKKLNPPWVKSLFDKGKPQIYRNSELKYIGMPIGGVCAGQVYLGGDGKLWLWDIFNHQHEGIVEGQCEFQGRTVRVRDGMNYVKPPEQFSLFEQGFGIKVTANEKTVTKTLDNDGFNNITFRGEYPVGKVTYQEDGFPLEIGLEAYSPFVPLNTDDSSLPATVMSYTVKNTSGKNVSVQLAGWMENAVCLHTGQPGQLNRKNNISQNNSTTILECSAEEFQKKEDEKPAQEDIVFETFEKETYDGWTVTGTAFGPGPIAKKEMPNYQDVGNIQGERLVNSHNVRGGENVQQGDAHTGTLTSKEFTIERKFINFLIGGGSHKDKTCINLIIDGKAVRTATGKNSNTVSPAYWDVSELQGIKAQIQIVDDYTGGWGNIGVDNIVFSDNPAEIQIIPLNERYDFGTMTLALLDAGSRCSGCALTAREKVFDDLSGSEVLKNIEEKPFGDNLMGALGKSFSLKAGQKSTVTFIITWHFPNLKVSGFRDANGRYYASKFNSAGEVVGYIAANYKRLAEQTSLWNKTWYDSTLPWWFLDRTFANTSTLATSTVYRFADGRFYGWEGIGCCPGTCTHVWHYAQAVARVFPVLEKDLRERMDFGLSFHADTGLVDYRGEFGRYSAHDGQAGVILRAYREHQMTDDYEFLKRNWDKIKKALQYLIDLDKNGDGIIEGAQPNTLDAAWYGKIAWLSSLYLAALRAGEAMALEMNDVKFTELTRTILDKGKKEILKLYNGEYFIQIPDEAHMDAIGADTGCYIDQVFGQSWAFQLGLGRLYSEKHIKSALQSLWKYNFVPDVGPFKEVYTKGRPYAIAGDGGLIMCTWPKGGKRDDWEKHWQFGYFNECMSGFEWQVAGHMIWEGMLTEGLAISRAIHDRYHASLRNPYNEVECSDHYARAMASYGAFIAACGCEYHGPKGYLAFAPRLTPEDFRAAFITAKGWSTFTQKRDSAGQTEMIEIKYGMLELKELKFELAKGQKANKVTIKIADKKIASTFESNGQFVHVLSKKPIKLSEGENLTIEIQT